MVCLPGTEVFVMIHGQGDGFGNRGRKPGFQALLWGLALSVAGVICFQHLQMTWLPAEETQVVWITLRYPGASPLLVEQLVTAPVESALSQLANVERLDSYSLPSFAMIRLIYASGVDVREQEPRLLGEMRRLRNQLPQDVFRANISFVSPNSDERSSLRYAIQAPKGMELHRPFLEAQLAQVIRPHPGVLDQSLSGIGDASLLLTISPEQLARRNLTFHSIEQWMYQAYGQIALGRSGPSGQGFPVFQEGDAPTQTEILDMHFPLPGRSLSLSDIATLRQIPIPTQGEVQLDGAPVLYLQFDLDPQAQLLRNIRMIQHEMLALEERLPDDWHIRCVQNPIDGLIEELYAQVTRLGWTLLTVLLGLWIWSLNLRYALIAAFCLLSSISIAILGVYLSGIHIHLYSLSALSVAMGIMVDQTVLVGDAIRRGDGVRAMAVPLAAASLTTVGSLLPLFSLGRSQWSSLQDFTALLIVCLGSSLLVALWIVPAMVAHLPNDSEPWSASKDKEEKHPPIISLMHRARWVWRMCLISLIGIPVAWVPPQFDWLGGLSKDFIQDLHHHFYWDPPNSPALMIEISFPNPPPINQAKSLIDPLVKKFAAIPDGVIHHVDTRFQDNGDISMQISFHTKGIQSSDAEAIKSMAMRYAVEHDGCKWNIYGIGEGFSTLMTDHNNFQIVMKGYNYTQLDSLAGAVEDRLKNNERISSVDPHAQASVWRKSAYGYSVGFHPEMGVGEREDWVDQAKRFSQLISSPRSVLLTQNGAKKQYSLLIKAPDFESMELRTWLESRAPVGKFPDVNDGIQIQYENLPQVIVREDRSYIRRISFEYAGAYEFGKRWVNTELTNMTLDWPPGFEAELFERKGLPHQERINLFWVGLGILVIIWLICGILFDSILDGFRMLEAIPLALLGVLLTHQLGLAPLNEGAIAAIVLVMGLSVNNSIILLAKLKTLPEQDWVAARRAVFQKIRPIGLATISTLAGFIPIIVTGSVTSFWYSLAMFTSGGLLVGTLLLFLVWWPFWVKHNVSNSSQSSISR